jgi:hypothetical protein
MTKELTDKNDTLTSIKFNELGFDIRYKMQKTIYALQTD